MFNQSVQFLLVALSGVQAIAHSTTEIRVVFPAPAAGSPITSFDASIKGGSQTCNVLVSVSPLQCSLTGLQPGTSYRILASTSIGSVESDHTELPGYTLPDGKSSFIKRQCRVYLGVCIIKFPVFP